MHGRQRVELTPEEEVKKQKERQTKVAAYQFAMSKILDKRSKEELDAEMLSITAKVLAANPDISTLWNIRKDTLKKMKELDLTNFTDTVVPKELDFSEFCLKNNPKSYGAWYHRYWLMKETDFKRGANELKHCSKFLEYDDRNFHGWNYRKFLLDNCALVTLEEELQFTTEKISSNFSNFSSWHLRSTLLPQLSKSYLDEELDLVRNATFTDPKDQSSWLYHLWLLKSQMTKETPKLALLQATKTHILACFNVHVPVPSPKDISVDLAHVIWRCPLNTGRSKLWLMDITDTTNEPNMPIVVSGDYILQLFKCDSVPLTLGEVYGKFEPYFDEDTKPKSPAFEKLLREELTWVQELQELEPEIKWPIHTAITLMRMINFVEFKLKITECLNQIQKIDPKRINYYNDLRSKFVLEWILIDKIKADEEIIDLSGLQLTSLYYPERLCYYKVVNCSRNMLKNGSSLVAFINCNSLNISDNQIRVDTELIKLLQSLPNLNHLVSSGNPGFDLSIFPKHFIASVKIS